MRGSHLVAAMVGALALVFAMNVLPRTTGIYKSAVRETTHAMQIEAVKRGAAEWVVADDGTTTFRWKGEPEQPKEGE